MFYLPSHPTKKNLNSLQIKKEEVHQKIRKQLKKLADDDVIAQRACTHLIRVPVVGFVVDALALVALQQLLVVTDTHRPAHDLAHARHQ